MTWRIELTDSAKKQFGKFDKVTAKGITAFSATGSRRSMIPAAGARR